jgi:NAD(P)-dependent dehydrogenase (short-subunit alcohol dehydrogenase family)
MAGQDLTGTTALVTGASRGFGRAIAVALDDAGRGIRVNAVAPGPIASERLALTDEQREPLVGAVPLRRVGRAEEVAAAVWLCSDQASSVTGATIPVDGGKLAAGAWPGRGA